MAYGSPYRSHGPRYLPSVPSYGHIRASDADRDRTIEVLKTGFAEGRLTGEEFAERQDRALEARTYRDLAALTADLPVGPVGALVSRPVRPSGFLTARRINPLAVASVISAFVPFFGSVAAIVLGHAALREIRETGDRGTAVAAAGIALGYLVVAVFVLSALAAVLLNARSPGAYPTPPG
jgi:hypothetical protein